MQTKAKKMHPATAAPRVEKRKKGAAPIPKATAVTKSSSEEDDDDDDDDDDEDEVGQSATYVHIVENAQSVGNLC